MEVENYIFYKVEKPKPRNSVHTIRIPKEYKDHEIAIFVLPKN